MTLDLDSLRCFEAAATLLNFRLAAQRVALSPAAFSDRIKGLEADLNTQLFHRTTRKVRLTFAGERLLPQARKVLSEADKCWAIAQDHDTPQPVDLRIGTRYELGMSWLTPNIHALEARCPGLTLHLSFGSSQALVEQVYAGAIHGAITSATFTRSQLTYIPLHPETYQWVAAPELAGVITLENIAAQVLIDIDERLPLFRYFRDHQRGPHPWRFAKYRYMGTISAIRHMVLAGDGVAVLPSYFVADDLKAGALLPLFSSRPLGEDFFRLVFRKDQRHLEELTQIAADLKAIPLR